MTRFPGTEAEAQKAIELFKTNEEVSEISDDDPPFIDSPYLPDPGEAVKSRELVSFHDGFASQRSDD